MPQSPTHAALRSEVVRTSEHGSCHPNAEAEMRRWACYSQQVYVCVNGDLLALIDGEPASKRTDGYRGLRGFEMLCETQLLA